MKKFKNVINILVLILFCSIIFISTATVFKLNKVKANIVEVYPPEKGEFIMSDNYNNRKVKIEYAYNNNIITDEILLSYTNIKKDSSVSIFIDNSGKALDNGIMNVVLSLNMISGLMIITMTYLIIKEIPKKQKLIAKNEAI